MKKTKTETYIGGQPGSGKPHICTAIAGYYIKKRYDVKYMLWCEDSKRLKAVINEPEYQDELKKYKELLDSGIITQEEFDAKKKQILNLE